MLKKPQNVLCGCLDREQLAVQPAVVTDIMAVPVANFTKGSLRTTVGMTCSFLTILMCCLPEYDFRQRLSETSRGRRSDNSSGCERTRTVAVPPRPAHFTDHPVEFSGYHF